MENKIIQQIEKRIREILNDPTVCTLYIYKLIEREFNRLTWHDDLDEIITSFTDKDINISEISINRLLEIKGPGFPVFLIKCFPKVKNEKPIYTLLFE